MVPGAGFEPATSGQLGAYAPLLVLQIMSLKAYISGLSETLRTKRLTIKACVRSLLFGLGVRGSTSIMRRVWLAAWTNTSVKSGSVRLWILSTSLRKLPMDGMS